MILIIDNYDSFTFNIVQFLGNLGACSRVIRNDKITPKEVLALNPQAIIMSPGPSNPDNAGICLELTQTAAGKIPILGICLGHQVIGQCFGGKIIKAPEIMHGKLSMIQHHFTPLFSKIPSPFRGVRYHSLVVDPSRIPDCLDIIATTVDNNIIMGLTHKIWPIYGIQFHPESIASCHGHDLLANFLHIIGMTTKPPPDDVILEIF